MKQPITVVLKGRNENTKASKGSKSNSKKFNNSTKSVNIKTPAVESFEPDSESMLKTTLENLEAEENQKNQENADDREHIADKEELREDFVAEGSKPEISVKEEKINNNSSNTRPDKRDARISKKTSVNRDMEQDVIIVLSKTAIWAASKHMDEVIENIGDDQWDCEVYLKLMQEKLGNIDPKFYRKPPEKKRLIPDPEADMIDEIKAYMLSHIRSQIADGISETEALLKSQREFMISLPEIKNADEAAKLRYPHLQDKDALNNILGLLYSGLFLLGGGMGLLIALVNKLDFFSLFLSIFAGILSGIGLGLIVNLIVWMVDRYYLRMKKEDKQDSEK